MIIQFLAYIFSLLLCFPFSLQAQTELAQKSEDVEPVVILGGGTGGLTSALYLARANFSPLVLEGSSPGGLIIQSHSVQNWPGEFEIPGSELAEKMRAQAIASGSEFLSEEVIAVDFSKRPFKITTRLVSDPSQTHQIFAETCIIAMGTKSNHLQVPGETGPDGYWGKGVSNCAVCDGTFYRDRIVGIVGGGDAAVLEGLYLSQIAKEVHIFVRKDSFKAVETNRLETLLERPNVHVLYETSVVEIKGDGDKLTHVALQTKGKADLSDFPLDGLFLAIGSRPNTELFQGQLKLDDAGYIQLVKDLETSVPGVYAVGDIVDPVYKQAISAAGDGAKAAIQAGKYLSDKANGLIAAKKKRIKAKNSSPAVEAIAQNKEVVKPLPVLALTPGVIEISSKEQLETELNNADTPVLIDFYAKWCGPCKQVTPLFERTASQFSGKVKFLKVNVDKFYTLSQSYQITAMPTVLVLDTKGSIIDRRVGPDAISELLLHLDSLE